MIYYTKDTLEYLFGYLIFTAESNLRESNGNFQMNDLLKNILASFIFLSFFYLLLKSFRRIYVLIRRLVFLRRNPYSSEVRFGKWDVTLWISIFLIGKNN